MYTLGINAVFHDSSACIVKDGVLLAAAEEERFTHIKHGKRPVPFSTYELPFHAIDYCLKMAGIHLNDVDHIAYSFDPNLLAAGTFDSSQQITMPLQPGLQKSLSEVVALPAGTDVLDEVGKWSNPWDPLFLSYIVNAPRQLVDGWPHHLQSRFIGSDPVDHKWHFVEHHLSHAASAFLVSPFESAAVMNIDGRGEKATTSYYKGYRNELELIGQVDMPHSLGLLYERITTHLGFLHSSDEYKVMALASYGKPEFVNEFDNMIRVYDDGTYTIEDADLEILFGPKRKKSDAFDTHHFNIAHSLQKVLQDKVLQLVKWLHKTSGEENLCMAGGVALNCVLNAYLRDHGPFKNIWIQPAAGDAGTALGAAMWIDSRKRIRAGRSFVMDDVYWGPDFSDDAIEKFLRWAKVPFKKFESIEKEAAKILADNKIIGWYQGRMEFGPRALGSRSIIASPISPEMQARLNEVKDREDFRPVAPVVMEEFAPEWFEGAQYSPFMLFVYPVKNDKADQISAVRHVDGTARIQTISEAQHKKYYRLLKEFHKLTGVPVLVNTSFNTLGKPIVCTPRDAVECFWSSPFDALIIGSFLIEKKV